ncbi:XRE family transcriptional regulator [Phytohabitans sp. ZYX-F-186]|uniref:XRE family transcriptional regulator n=1 Tax=Phytohabitans maris TaxID=3071409 RepID=A0ABU0ZDS0_9ACTN|nr:XRE family transcriptional regulator [Phytohabitans sp. ZYX-F-186]MDQ7905204.1 XRE family transcriptional regulator [Phytohabitans sp. ZYX-F-186]
MSIKRSPDEADGVPDAAVAALGARLRAVRLRRRETLESLAGRSGLTKSFLSKLERGRASVSVSALLRICSALDVQLAEIMNGPEGRLVRAGGLTRVALGGEGLTEYQLTPGDEHRIQVLLSEIEPGGGSGAEYYTFPVEVEFVHVIKGRLTVSLEGEVHELAQGDALTFVSVPHAFHNPGPEPATVLWVMTPALPRDERSVSR